MNNQNINGIIYCALNLINGKKYIGQTIAKLKVRISNHYSTNGCPYFHKAIKKYGKDWFDWKIIDTASTIDELNEKEIYWIKKLNTLTPNGYNLTMGGKNCLMSNETKRKRAKSMGCKLITFNGESLYPFEWEEKIGIKKNTIIQRLKYGWTIEDAISTKLIKGRLITFNNKTQNLSEWAKEIGVSPNVLFHRLKNGMSLYNALNNPKYIPKTLTFNGKTLLISGWSKETGIEEMTLRTRIKNGWSIEKTLTTKCNPLTKFLTYNNKTMNISQWAKETGIGKTTILYRLKHNFSIEDILTK